MTVSDHSRCMPDVQERNLLYVIEVETFVTSVLRPFTTDTVDDTW
jgi:hypothetical protein